MQNYGQNKYKNMNVTSIPIGQIFFILLIFGIILSLPVIPARIAENKGKNFFGFYIYGLVILPIAIAHALIMKPENKTIEINELNDGTRKKCKFCAELIKTEAMVCRFCGREC